MDPVENKGNALPVSIAGVRMQNLAQITTEGGSVLHMLRSDSSLFRSFGEIYFSVIEPGAVKAWKLHHRQTQNFAVPSGLVRIVVYDDREGSPSKGELEEFTLGRPDSYRLLTIPPGLWYGFSCLGTTAGILANCADIPHSPEEAVRIPQKSPLVPYSWIP